MLLMAETLVAKGNADPNIQDHRGRTPLHLACRSNALFIQPLLSMGADAAIADGRGKTTLHHAAEGNSVPSKFRRSASSKSLEGDTDKQPAKPTPHPHGGEARVSRADIRALLQHGADITARDQAGRTALEVLTLENEALRPLLEGKGKGHSKGKEKRLAGTQPQQQQQPAAAAGAGDGSAPADIGSTCTSDGDDNDREGTGGDGTKGTGPAGPPTLLSSSEATQPTGVPPPHPGHTSVRHTSRDSISTEGNGSAGELVGVGTGVGTGVGSAGAGLRPEGGRADTPPLYPTSHPPSPSPGSGTLGNTAGSVSSLRSLSPSLDAAVGSAVPSQMTHSTVRTRRRSTPAAVISIDSNVGQSGPARSSRRRSSAVSLKSHTSSTHSLPTQVIQVESVVTSESSPAPE
eukprot:TRINITY_DN4481_c2_g2_i1.p1 TRINITY_DN4481_c2_g2~~TRINITY_DN4481_c2_g2_i1.p1  ORF type:complete len:454 (+),score=90.60 TRINITY_DN4481_c2_g2_i1:151-1362(+)